MTLEIRVLPARQGDALWIRWGDGHQMLVDLGTEETGRAIADRLLALPEEERAFDLLVITHVDGDHIGGAMSALADRDDPVPGLRFDDVWFNGWEHLHGLTVPRPEDRGGLEGMGPAQGERLTSWLRDQRWNEAFDRGPAVRPDGAPPVRELPGGLRLTLLGPTQDDLAALRPTWKAEVEKALEKGSLEEASPGLGPGGGRLESFGSTVRPVLDTRTDLELLAETATAKDGSRANGASIVLLLEHEGRRVLLTGDAFGADVVAGLRVLDPDGPVPVDVVKLPHHGSSKNVTRELVEAVESPYWLVSTDGTTFHHPDAIAIARVLRYAHRHPPTVGFNVPSETASWWGDPQWEERFAYTAQFGSPDQGLTLRWGSGELVPVEEEEPS